MRRRTRQGGRDQGPFRGMVRVVQVRRPEGGGYCPVVREGSPRSLFVCLDLQNNQGRERHAVLQRARSQSPLLTPRNSAEFSFVRAAPSLLPSVVMANTPNPARAEVTKANSAELRGVPGSYAEAPS